MTDTGQPLLAPENVALENAASAFKAFTNEEPINQPRDDQGRFAGQEPEADDEPAVAEQPSTEVEDEIDEDGEAADEAQPEPLDMPSSWSKDDQEVWEALPADAQARIAEREAERDRGLNAKLQEAANARKAVEAQVAEANANRDKYAQAIDTVLSLASPQEPNPMDYGMGTADYDRDAYDIAKYQYDQQRGIITQLVQQRQEIAAQQAREAEEAFSARHSEIEQTWFPKFTAECPDLKDPAKASDTVNSIVRYAIDNGIPQEAFSNPKAVTSAEMRIAWKAMQFDRIKAAEGRVKSGNPPPKPASPPVKPGGVATRQSVQARSMAKAQARLVQEGSVEAAADVFKLMAPLR